MSDQQVRLDKLTGVRFLRAVKNFADSEVGWKAKLMFAALVALFFAINGFNVVNSYVGRDFMTAIANRNQSEFIHQGMLYVAVFAGSTVVAVVSRFTEERLGVLWREFLTKRIVHYYLENGTYFMMKESGELANPDQRIADDVRAFTSTTLSFVLMLMNSSFTAVAFSGVLWSISPLLFLVALIYAALGSYLTILLGRPLVKLNYDQLDKEANFRASLIHVRENAEPLLLIHREDRIGQRLLQRIADLIGNFRRITSVNRNLGFFTTGYNWLIQIIPAFIVAPLFIRGDVEFGVITQSTMAFTMLLGALSLIVTQFQSISSFAAVVSRLGSLAETFEQTETAAYGKIEIHPQEEDRLVYVNLSLWSADHSAPLIRNLSIEIPLGSRVLVRAANRTASIALIKATAGIWLCGEGRILRPGENKLSILTQRPYLPPGSLWDVLVPADRDHMLTDDFIVELLSRINLETVLARTAGLHVEQNWDSLLSLGEQQQLAFLNLLLKTPGIALLESPGSALTAGQAGRMLELLNEHAIGYIYFGQADDTGHSCDAILDIGEDGGWTWQTG